MRSTILLFAFFTTSIVYSQTLIPFLQDSTYGYSNLEGKQMISAQYDEVEFFDDNNQYAPVRIGSKWYIINNKGERIPNASFDCKPEFKNIGYYGLSISEAFKLGRNESNYPLGKLVIAFENYRCDSQAKTCTVFNPNKLRALEISKFIDPLNCAFLTNIFSDYKNGVLIASKPNSQEFELYDEELNLIAKSKYRPQFFKNGMFFFYDNGGFLYDINLKKIISSPFPFLDYDPINENYIYCSQPKSPTVIGGRFKCGVCDSKFNILIDSLYNFITPYDGKYSCSQYNGQALANLLDAKGLPLISNKSTISSIANNKYIYVKDTLGKITLLNNDLSLVPIGEFDDLDWNSNGNLFHYKKGDLAGILDSNFIKIFEYPASRIDKTKDPNLFHIEIDRKHGIVNKNKNIIIPPLYQSCYMNPNGFFRLSSTTTRKNGLASKEGEIIIDTLYDRIEFDSIDKQLYIHAEIDRKWIYFDTKGNVIQEAREDNSSLWSKLEAEQFAIKQVHYIQNSDGKSALDLFESYVQKHEYMNPDAIMVHPGKNRRYYACSKDLNFIAGSSNENATVTKFNEVNKLLAFETEEGEGIVNFENESILPVGDREIIDIEDHYILIKEDKKYDFYDLNLKKLYPFSFDYVKDYYQGPLRRIAKNITGSAYQYIQNSCLTNSTDTLVAYKKNYGYVDKYGKIFIAPMYAFAGDFDDGFALVGTYNQDSIIQSVVIDTLGKVVHEFDLGVKPVNWSSDKKSFLALKNDKYGFIDSMGQVIIDFKYEWVIKFNYDNLYHVKVGDEKWNLITSDGKVIYDEKTKLKQYDLERLTDNFTLVCPDGEMEVIDTETGEKIIKFEGDDAKLIDFKGIPMIKVEKDGRFFYVNYLDRKIYKS